MEYYTGGQKATERILLACGLDKELARCSVNTFWMKLEVQDVNRGRTHEWEHHMPINQGPCGPESTIDRQLECDGARLFGENGLADSLSLAVVAWDLEATITRWNSAAERMFGWRREEVIGGSMLRLLPAPTRTHMERILEMLRRQELSVYSVNQNRTSSGRLILCEWHNSVIRSQDGEVVGGLGFARDVTQDLHLKVERESLSAIAAAASGGMDLNEVLLLVRRAVLEVGEFDRAGIWLLEDGVLKGTWGTDLEGRIHAESGDIARFDQFPISAGPVLRGELPYVVAPEPSPLAHVRPDSPLADCVCVALKAGQTVVGVIMADRVLTDQPIADEEVQRVLPLARQAAVAIAAVRMYDLQAQALDRHRRLASIAAAINASVNLDGILRMVRDAAVEVGGFDRAAVFLYDRGKGLLYGTWGTDRDGRPENISDLVFQVPADSPYPTCRVAREELAYALTDNLTADWDFSEDHPMYGVGANAVLPLRAGGRVVGLLSLDNLMSGRLITEESIEGILPFTEQAAVAIQNYRLFTELHDAQEALVRSEKMRAVGELASGVAHNVNNVLAAVLGYAELIKDADGTTAEIAQYARTIERAALDGAEIVRRVQRFARRQEPAHGGVIDVAAVAQEAIDLTRPAWRNEATGRGVQIAISADLQPGLYVAGVESEIREVLINLIRNSVDAIEREGRITIRTYGAGVRAIIEVSDDGLGMDEATQARVFDPFFSTKGAGRGTGLGLSVAWGILERHAGSIAVESVPGTGTRFRIDLLRTEYSRSSDVSGGPERGIDGKRLLLVDDEEIVLGGMAQVLAVRGASIAICSDASEALAWLAEHEGACDVIISDHGMAGMTGAELLAVVRSEYPAVKRILLSGWGGNLPGNADASAAQAVLSKPVSSANLVAAIAALTNC